MTGKLQVRPSTLDDCAELAATMRWDDRVEIDAASGRSPLTVLLDGFARSVECNAALYDGRVMCIWGVVPEGTILGGRVGCVWMLTSDLVEKYPLAFYRQCKVELRGLMSRWDVLSNFIACSHAKAIRWAKRLGLQFGNPEPYGIKQELFVQFFVVEDDHVRTSDVGGDSSWSRGGGLRDEYCVEVPSCCVPEQGR